MRQEKALETPLKLETPLRVAIIGTGKAARFHARAIKAIDGAAVACFVNRGSTTGLALVESPEVPRHSSIAEARKHNPFDAAIVAVSWESTASVAGQFLADGVPVLIEKPLGVNAEEAGRLVAAGAGKTAFVAYNLRFQSSILHAVDVIHAFGPPYAVHIDAPEQSILAKTSAGVRSLDVARQWLVLNTTHALDLFGLLLGHPLDVCAAAPARYFDGVPCDHAALVRSVRGATGVFSSHWRSPGSWTMQVYGPDYRLSAGLNTNSLDVQAPGMAVTHAPSTIDKDFKPGVLLQDYYFLRSVVSGTPAHRHLAALDDGLAVIQLAENLQHRELVHDIRDYNGALTDR